MTESTPRTKATRPGTIDEYIGSVPEPARQQLRDLRRICRDAAPQASEQIKWGYPAYVHPDGVILFVFSSHKAHTNITFTPSTRAAFDDELSSLRTGKGGVALPHGTKPPRALLRRMIEHRIREYEEEGVKWM